jgi:CubicO group peptidase (beta-lactamase class C family)
MSCSNLPRIRNAKSRGRASLAAVVLLTVCVGASQGASRAQLSRAARAAVEPGGGAIGMQILVGRGEEEEFFKVYGRRSIDRPEPVDKDTMFCIGSCSKPLSSVAILRSADAGKLKLNQTIDTWLPAFASTRLKGGRPARRAPTLYDLLSHRGGIFSQKIGLKPGQGKLLYKYDHTLEYAVDEMAKYEYLWEPGTQFAYSGAGYCIAGRVAEVAESKEFDRILQERLCQPLGMSRTTYFPGRIDANIAAGAVRRKRKMVAANDSPHLAEPHEMQLIGGSLYSTAADLAKFARMIARRGVTDDGRFLSATRWSDMVRLRGRDSKYGLGWIVTRLDNKVVKFAHNGALSQYRANLLVHPPTQSYLAFVITLGPNDSAGAKKGKSKGGVGLVASRYFQRFIQN